MNGFISMNKKEISQLKNNITILDNMWQHPWLDLLRLAILCSKDIDQLFYNIGLYH